MTTTPKPMLPLEIWHNVFEHLALPRVDVKIADWSGIEFPNLQMHGREPNIVATILALTHEDILFPGSALAIWEWLASVASWRVDRSTDAWRLWRLERSYNFSVKSVTAIVYFPEKTHDGKDETRLSQYLDSQYETFKDLAKLSNLRRLMVVVTCDSGNDTEVLIERLRKVIEKDLDTIEKRMAPGCAVDFNFMFYFIRRHTGIERTSWGEAENITDLWNKQDLSLIKEELSKIRSSFLLEQLTEIVIAQHSFQN